MYKKTNTVQLYADRKLPFTVELNIGDDEITPTDLTQFDEIKSKVRSREFDNVAAEFEILNSNEYLSVGRLVMLLDTTELNGDIYYFDVVAIRNGVAQKLVSGQINMKHTYTY
jgi:hypothetical protein